MTQFDEISRAVGRIEERTDRIPEIDGKLDRLIEHVTTINNKVEKAHDRLDSFLDVPDGRMFRAEARIRGLYQTKKRIILAFIGVGTASGATGAATNNPDILKLVKALLIGE